MQPPASVCMLGGSRPPCATMWWPVTFPLSQQQHLVLCGTGIGAHGPQPCHSGQPPASGPADQTLARGTSWPPCMPPRPALRPRSPHLYAVVWVDDAGDHLAHQVQHAVGHTHSLAHSRNLPAARRCMWRMRTSAKDGASRSVRSRTRQLLPHTSSLRTCYRNNSSMTLPVSSAADNSVPRCPGGTPPCPLASNLALRLPLTSPCAG